MRSEKLERFIECLSDQLKGDGSAVARGRALKVSVDDGYCFFNLWEQWYLAFAFKPGRLEALEPVAALARKILDYKKDDTLKLFREDEWAVLVGLRGPVESVLHMQCDACRTRYVSMGTSGFYDAGGFVCVGCGNVLFRSFYDEAPMPRCSCGKEYKLGCPKCGKSGGKIVSESSPFQYFAKHRYERAPGA